MEEFLKNGSRKSPLPSATEEAGKDIPCTAMLAADKTSIMTEMMDCFCDNAALREQYIFKGIASQY